MAEIVREHPCQLRYHPYRSFPSLNLRFSNDYLHIYGSKWIAISPESSSFVDDDDDEFSTIRHAPATLVPLVDGAIHRRNQAPAVQVNNHRVDYYHRWAIGMTRMRM